MRTNIDIDDELMSQAMRCTGARTKKAAVEAGLRLLIDVHAQVAIRDLRGKSASKNPSTRTAAKHNLERAFLRCDI